jgi:hypothetical protein
METRKIINKKNQLLLLLDAFLLVSFWLLNQVHLTGIVIHEWFGVALGLVLLLHVGLHWRWIVSVFRKFFHVKNWLQAVKLVLDCVGFIAFFTIIISGILMSRSFLPALGLSGTHSRSLKMLHMAATNATIAMLALHLLLNVKWVLRTIGSLFTHREKPVAARLIQPE